MRSLSRAVGGRMAWLTIFALLLPISAAAPLLAVSATDDTAVVGPGGQLVEGLPSGKQVAEGLQEADLEEVEEEEKRETAAAGEEREDSLEAFADASPAEAMVRPWKLIARQ